MRTFLHWLTMLLLTLMTFVHLAVGFSFYFFQGDSWILVLLIAVLFPPIVMMRKSTQPRWTALDLILLLPGLVPPILLASLFKPTMDQLLVGIALYAFVMGGPIVLACIEGKNSSTS